MSAYVEFPNFSYSFFFVFFSRWWVLDGFKVAVLENVNLRGSSKHAVHNNPTKPPLPAPRYLQRPFRSRAHIGMRAIIIFNMYIPLYTSLPCASLSIPSYSSPKLALTFARHRFRNSFVSSLHSLAASTFAGLSSFGLLSMLITLRRIVSGVCTGDQRSEAAS